MRVAEQGLPWQNISSDKEHQNVPLFIDNISVFTQAGSEVSFLLGRMPLLLISAYAGYGKWVNYRKELLLQRMVLLHLYRLFMCCR